MVLANPTCIRYFQQRIYHAYGHIRCADTVLANPTFDDARELIGVAACALLPSPLPFPKRMLKAILIPNP